MSPETGSKATGSKATVSKATRSKATGLGRASALGAVGTIGSRLTGFVRTVIVVAVLGTGGFADAYNYANTTPNIVYDLLLGGVLSSVVVPLLVRANREDADDGTGFAQALLSTVTVALGLLCLVAVIAAPLVIGIYLPGNTTAADRARAVLFTRFFLPQLVFYAITAVSGAILNTRGRFGRDTAVPILNNLIVIATALVFVLAHGHRPPTATGTSTTDVVILATGTTLGVVVMAIALLPSLRAAGVPWRWRFDLPRDRLRTAGRLAGWVLLAVVVSQLGFVVVARLAGSEAGSRAGYTAYSTAYQLFQLPYAVVGVSVISALLPQMSRHAAARQIDALRGDVSRGLRLALVLVIPGSLLLAAAAGPVCVAILRGNASISAVLIGQVLAIFALALVPFTLQQVLLRSFYAQNDSRTPALVTCAVTVVLVGSDLVIASQLSGTQRVVGLAGGFGIAYLVGALVAVRLTRHRLGGHGARVLRLAIRVSVVSIVAVGVGWLIAEGVGALLHGAVGPSLRALVELAVIGGVTPLLYVQGVRRLRVREAAPLVAAATSLFSRIPGRAQPR